MSARSEPLNSDFVPLWITNYPPNNARRARAIEIEQGRTRYMIRTLQESALRVSTHSATIDRNLATLKTRAREARATADSAMALTAVSTVMAATAIILGLFSHFAR